MTWSSDVTPSLPSPPKKDQPQVLQFQETGFGFTSGGICFDLTESDLDSLARPMWAPPGEQP